MKWATKETLSNLNISSTEFAYGGKKLQLTKVKLKHFCYKTKPLSESNRLNCMPRVLSFKYHMCRDVKNYRHNFCLYTLIKFCKKNLIWRKKKKKQKHNRKQTPHQTFVFFTFACWRSGKHGKLKCLYFRGSTNSFNKFVASNRHHLLGNSGSGSPPILEGQMGERKRQEIRILNYHGRTSSCSTEKTVIIFVEFCQG